MARPALGKRRGGGPLASDLARRRRGERELLSVDGSTERAALELDRMIHERTRLGIVSALAVNPTLTFSELKALLRTTDGNLSVHARKLEQAEYVTCAKYFQGRVPRTEFRQTAAGRRALERYLNHMEALIRVTRSR